MDYAREVAAALAAVTGINREELEGYLETPPDPQMGDIALPCFKLAKTMKAAPAAIAADLASRVALPAGVARAEAAGGYLNFYLDGAGYAQSVLEAVLGASGAYGAGGEGAGKTVVVEFSSINIAKPFHIGHLPTTAIGNALCRVFRHLGYSVTGINYLGDWGTQFGKMIVAYKLWGDKPAEQYRVRELVKLYVRFHEEAEKDESLNEQARQWFRKIETGDPEAVGLWRAFKELTLREVAPVYDLLGVTFDSYDGESFFEDKMQPVIQELADKGISRVDNGAVIVDLSDHGMPPCIIRKSDGGSIYATRDIAAAIYRKKTYDFHRCLYVVAYQQNLHFRQFFKVLELMGYDWVRDCEHVNFGMVSIEEGTLSTRSGNVVYLEDVLAAAVDKARRIMLEKSPDLADPDIAARQVGVGAVVWSMLYNQRIKDISFSYDKALNFDGETGPYAQYTYARCRSVLRRAGEYDAAGADYAALADAPTLALIRALAGLPEAIREAAARCEPYLVARSVIEICSAYNKFYIDHRILEAEPPVRAARLLLTRAVAEAVKTGLYLLGLEAPERM